VSSSRPNMTYKQK